MLALVLPKEDTSGPESKLSLKLILVHVDFRIGLNLYNPKELIDYIVDCIKRSVGLGKKRKRDSTIPSAVKPLR